MAIQGSPWSQGITGTRQTRACHLLALALITWISIFRIFWGKPKGVQDTWVIVTYSIIHKYPSLKTSIKTAANKINNATFFQSFQRFGCPWSTLTSVFSVLTPLTAPFGSGSTKPGERASVSCSARAIWKCSPAEVISTCTIFPMRSPSLLWIRT